VVGGHDETKAMNRSEVLISRVHIGGTDYIKVEAGEVIYRPVSWFSSPKAHEDLYIAFWMMDLL
jgi:hypothetical protein